MSKVTVYFEDGTTTIGEPTYFDDEVLGANENEEDDE